MKIAFHEAVGAGLAVIAMGLIGYEVVKVNDQAALGAAIGVVSAAVGFFLRGKVGPAETSTNIPDLPPRG